MNIVHITDDAGRVVERGWLKRAEGVHRQLRTALPDDYEGKMKRVFAGGARMCVATEGGAVRGVAVYRISENTFEGLHLYVDDLVTDERLRSRGVGRALMEHLQGLARAADCEVLDGNRSRLRNLDLCGKELREDFSQCRLNVSRAC